MDTNFRRPKPSLYYTDQSRSIKRSNDEWSCGLVLPHRSACFLHPSETSPWEEATARHVDANSFYLLKTIIQELLDTYVKKRMVFQIWEEKENKKGSFPKYLRQDYQTNYSGTTKESLARLYPRITWAGNTTSPCPLVKECKPEYLHCHQLCLNSKTFVDHLQHKV